MTSVKMKPLPLSQVYELLETGPVVLVSTAHEGRTNVMTLSWHLMMDFEPPLIGCVLSANNFTFNFLEKSRECVIAIPTVEFAKTVVKVGNCSGLDVDKFKKFNIATAPASKVKAPLLPQCYANLECKVVDRSLVEKYNFIVLKVVAAWVDPAKKHPKTLHHMGNGVFMVAGKVIKLPSKMK